MVYETCEDERHMNSHNNRYNNNYLRIQCHPHRNRFQMIGVEFDCHNRHFAHPGNSTHRRRNRYWQAGPAVPHIV